MERSGAEMSSLRSELVWSQCLCHWEEREGWKDGGRERGRKRGEEEKTRRGEREGEGAELKTRKQAQLTNEHAIAKTSSALNDLSFLQNRVFIIITFTVY